MVGSVSASSPTQTSEVTQDQDSDEDYNDGDYEDYDDEDFYDDDAYFEGMAQLLNMDVDALFNEMDAGKSLADIATTQGVDPQVLIDYIVADEAEFIDEMLADGEITQEEADEWRAETAKWAVYEVNHVAYDPFKVAQDVIGIDEETLWNELESGKTGAEIATANGVEPQAVIDALIAAENAEVDAMLAAGLISDEEAAEWKAESADIANDLVNTTLDDLEEEWEDGDWEDDYFFDEIAGLLNMDVDALFAELDAGKTLAEIATAQGVDPQVLIDYIIADEAEWIQEELDAGYITEAEAEEWRAESADYANEMVNSTMNELEADWDQECDEDEHVDDEDADNEDGSFNDEEETTG